MKYLTIEQRQTLEATLYQLTKNAIGHDPEVGSMTDQELEQAVTFMLLNF